MPYGSLAPRHPFGKAVLELRGVIAGMQVPTCRVPFGWALVLGGAARVVAPGVVEDVGGVMMNRPTMTRVVGVCWAAVGVFLTFKGYS